MKDEIIRVKLLATVVLAMAFLGCGGKADVSQQPTVVPMRVVTDDLGREVTVPVRITRVISLAPSVTENIFAVGAGDRLVGVTTFCNYPEEAKAIAKVGDTLTPNMETIIALKPDVVFVSTASQIENFMKTLEANGIAIYVTNPTSLQGVFENLKQLGIIFDTENASSVLVKSLEDREWAVRQACNTVPVPDETWAEYKGKVQIVSVFLQISKEPLFTIGKTAFLNDLLERGGGQSVTANIPTAYPKLSKETASALNPEVIILSDSEDNKEPNDAFKNSPAVKNGRVYKVNADILSRPGPRLVDALEQIAKDLHPEKFK
jgi:iron complex transport system substrate-binding protein